MAQGSVDHWQKRLDEDGTVVIRSSRQSSTLALAGCVALVLLAFVLALTGSLVGIVSMRDLMRIAQIQPAENLAHDVPRGLEGVVVAETTIGDVRGLEGFYHYRQYDAIELAETRMLEDVWYLLYHDDLPTSAQRAEFQAEIRPLREIPAEVASVLPALAETAADAPPLDLLRTGAELIGERYFAVPWRALARDAEGDGFVLDIDQDTLAAAPGFDSDHWPSMTDEAWAAELHAFYRALPYWE